MTGLGYPDRDIYTCDSEAEISNVIHVPHVQLSLQPTRRVHSSSLQLQPETSSTDSCDCHAYGVLLDNGTSGDDCRKDNYLGANLWRAHTDREGIEGNPALFHRRQDLIMG